MKKWKLRTPFWMKKFKNPSKVLSCPTYPTVNRRRSQSVRQLITAPRREPKVNIFKMRH